MKSVILKGSIAIVALVVISIALTSVQSPTSNKPGPIPSIRIAVSTTPLSAPFYVADRLGYFQEAGIKVDIQDIAGGQNCFKALIKGETDLATASNSVIMFNRFQYNNFSVLASFVESENDLKILTLKNSQIQIAADLVGRTVGIIPGSASEYFLHTWLISEGIDPVSVQTKTLNVEAMPDALHSQQVDAISTWEPYAFKAIHNYPTPISMMQTKALYRLSFNLVSRRNLDVAQEQNISRVLIALNKAVHYMDSYPEESQLILRHRLKLQKEFIDWIWQDYQFQLSLSQSLLDSIEQQASWAINAGLVQQGPIPNYSEVFDGRLLKTIDE